MNKAQVTSQQISAPGFRPVPKTGVIYVMSRAKEYGYGENPEEWANLGQGAPETGEIAGAPERLLNWSFTTDDLEYAPVDGMPELKAAVAELYNARHRDGKSSKYTEDNVAICSGGRLAVTRAVSALGRTNVGHFLPDYTAYEELLDSFSSFVPIPILLDSKNKFEFNPERLKEEILGKGLSSLLLSNPCNPTGKLVTGAELEIWTQVAREHQCTMIFDEFYSHYLYDSKELSNSAASYVEDVNEDPVILIDGLTKNWRYPGFRVSWTVGPKSVIEAVSSAGSFIDGGCARPIQLAAVQLLDRSIADQEAKAIQNLFAEKRKFMVDGLAKLGIEVESVPEGGFYCWGSLAGLKGEMSNSMHFFEEALKAKVITVPGIFFDINPGQRRPDRPSRFTNFCRFSFGPSLEELERGLNSLKSIV